jgi:hypothetical protein
MSLSFHGRVLGRPGTGTAPSGTEPASRGNLAVGSRGFWQVNRLLAQPAPLFAALLAVALLARMQQFGNPVVHVDDQFYLLVGDRLLHGALPYVDIWDRKPIGLFLIYAAIRLFGGSGVIQYQLAATMFATATAYVIARLARQTATALGGALAGAAYLLYLGLFGGDGGQAPVFYELPVALAVAATWRATARRDGEGPSVGWGTLAMALAGLALQIKYSALFEGVFLALVLLYRAYSVGASRMRLIRLTLLWAAVGAAPTLVAWSSYAALGHGAVFYQANFESILARRSDGGLVLAGRLLRMVIPLIPLGLLAFAGQRVAMGAGGSPARREAARLFGGWAASAAGGVLIFGGYFDHYALPLLPPLALCAAPFLAGPRAALVLEGPGVRWRFPPALPLLLLAGTLTHSTIDTRRAERGWSTQFNAMATQIRSRLQGCLFVYDGDVALYRATNSCLPTRWVFPNHLNLWREDGALGVDPLEELHRIMAGKPHLVVAAAEPDAESNPRSTAFMQLQLARDYVPVYRSLGPGRQTILFERRADR